MSYTRRTEGPGKHGYLRDYQCPREYRIWSGMVQRCCNPNCRIYKYYGGRGIKVCDRWLEAQGFPNFLADVGRQPFPRASLHRIDNDAGYRPGNVIWTNQRTQLRNTRANRVLKYRGRSMVLVAWSEKIGMKRVTLSQRLHKDWSVAKALTVPVKKRKPYSQWVRKPNPKKPGPKPRNPANP